MNNKPIFRLPPFEAKLAPTALSEIVDWSIDFLHLPDAWKVTQGEGVKVAVLDTGCDLQHPDLQGAILEAKDFSGSIVGVRDRQSHGTWCAGMIAARANNTGVRGAAPLSQLFIGKVLGDDGTGSEDNILAGIEWATAVGADIISMSLGGPQMSDSVRQAIAAFVSKPGHFCICAAGNDGRDNSVGYPAKWPETIAVAAVDKTGALTSFSSRGPEVDISAPGQDMISTVPVSAGSYAKMSGTSMATPVVAAVTALALSKHRKAGGTTGLETVADLIDHLKKTAKDAGAPGRDDGYGWGIIDPAGLLNDVDALPPTPPVTPPPPAKPPTVTLAIDGWQAQSITWKRVP